MAACTINVEPIIKRVPIWALECNTSFGALLELFSALFRYLSLFASSVRRPWVTPTCLYVITFQRDSTPSSCRLKVLFVLFQLYSERHIVFVVLSRTERVDIPIPRSDPLQINRSAAFLRFTRAWKFAPSRWEPRAWHKTGYVCLGPVCSLQLDRSTFLRLHYIFEAKLCTSQYKSARLRQRNCTTPHRLSPGSKAEKIGKGVGQILMNISWNNRLNWALIYEK